MKVYKVSIFLAIMLMLVLTGISVSAEIDETGDVFHWKGVDWRNWGWNVQDRPNIDITDVSYTAGDRLTISLTVQGSVNSEKSYYHVWYNSSDAWYHLHYSPDDETEPIAVALPIDFYSWDMEDMMNYTEPEWESSIIDDNTITVTIDWVTEDHTMNGFHGWAQQWENEEEKMIEAWFDFAPNNYAWYGEYDDYYSDETNNNGENGNGGSTTDENGSPGFEVVALIAGIALLIFVFRKKK